MHRLHNCVAVQAALLLALCAGNQSLANEARHVGTGLAEGQWASANSITSTRRLHQGFTSLPPSSTSSPLSPMFSPTSLPPASSPSLSPSPQGYVDAPAAVYDCANPYTLTAGQGVRLTAPAGVSVGDMCILHSGVRNSPPCRASLYSEYAVTWTILAAETLSVQVETCTTTPTTPIFDTILTVRGGCSPTNTTVWCNDDAFSVKVGSTSCGTHSFVSFVAQAGHLYTLYLQLYDTGTKCWPSPSVAVMPMLGGAAPPAADIGTSPAADIGTSPAADIGTSPSPPLAAGMNSSVISFVLSFTAAASVVTDTAVQQRFLADVAVDVASYFQIDPDEVDETLLLGGDYRRRLQLSSSSSATRYLHVVIHATPTWRTADTVTPARLQQRWRSFLAAPASVLAADTVQQYSIDASSITLGSPNANEPSTSSNGPTPSPAGSSQGGLPTGAIIGIAVGAGALALIVATAVGVFLWRRKRRTPPHAAMAAKAMDPMPGHLPPYGGAGMPGGVMQAPRSASSPDQPNAVVYVHGLHPITNGSGVPSGAVGTGPTRPQYTGSSQASAVDAAQPAPPQAAAQQGQVPDGLHISWSDITLSGSLGNGSHGQVFKGAWLHSEVAVKMLTLNSAHSDAQLAGLRYVSQVMRDLHHPALARVFGLVEEPAQQVYALVMQLYRRGTLAAHITSPEYAQVPLNTRLRWAIQIADAMSFLHSKPRPVLHLDLKASNILMQEGHKLVISDFGVVACLDAGKVPPARNESAAAITPPEVWSHPYNPRTSPALDVYAFGTVLWEIMAGQHAFRGESVQSIQQLVMQGRRPAVPAHVAPSIATIIQDCWREDVSCRPPFSMLVGCLLGALQEVAPQEDLTEVATTLTTTF